MEKRMPYGSQGAGSGTKALLDKVSAQLRGERLNKPLSDGRDDELGEYLSTLTKKSSTDVQWDKFGEPDYNLDDEPAQQLSRTAPVVSSSGKGSTFLKKKPLQSSSQPYATVETKSSTNPSTSQLRSSSTDRAGEIMKKYGRQVPGSSQKGQGRGSSLDRTKVMSDSDADLSLSLDEDVLRDVPQHKRQNVSESQDFTKSNLSGGSSSGTKPTRGVFRSNEVMMFTDEDSISSPRQIGKYSADQFLKKKPAAEPVPVTIPDGMKEMKMEKTPRKDIPTKVSSPRKAGSSTVLDTDEESLAEYIEGLSSVSSVSASRSPKHKPKSSLNNSGKHNEKKSANMKSVKEIELLSEAESDDYKINVQDLEDLDYISDEHSSALSPRKPSPFRPHPESSKIIVKSKNDTKNNSTAKSKKPSEGFLDRFGIHSVDELLDEDSDEMRIPEALEESDYDVGPRSSRTNISPRPALRSILSPTPRSITPRSSRSRVRLMDELIEVRSRSPSPEPVKTGRSHRSKRSRASSISSIPEEERTPSRTDSESTIRTAWDSGTEASVRSDSDSEYTKSSRKHGESRLRISNRNSRHGSSYHGDSRPSSRASFGYSYSDDFTDQSTGESSPTTTSELRSITQQSITNSYTDDDVVDDDDDRSDMSIRETRVTRGPHRVKDSSVQTGLDTAGLHYQWLSPVERDVVAGVEYGLSHVQPSSIAATVVSPDTLEALTAYSPATLALNDMLRMQLDLTRQFMMTQKRLYQGLVQSIDSSYTYTTLNDTKEYICRHRKPRSSYEKILKEVKEEMGLA